MGLDLKKSTAVLVPELIVAPLSVLGAVLCMEKAPRQMQKLDNFVSKHVVLPHLETFEKFGNGLQQAHHDYDKRMNEERAARGEPLKPEAKATREERAYAISDALVRTTLALGVDCAATYGSQRALNNLMKAGIQPFKTAFTEASVHLGVMALMPTVFARFSENVRFKISNTLQHTFGTDKHYADDRAQALTYVNMPGYVAAIASLVYAHTNGVAKHR